MLADFEVGAPNWSSNFAPYLGSIADFISQVGYETITKKIGGLIELKSGTFARICSREESTTINFEEALQSFDLRRAV